MSHYDVLVQCLLLYLPQRVANLAADAAFDAWYIYEAYAEIGGIAAIPLKESPQRIYQRESDGVPLPCIEPFTLNAPLLNASIVKPKNWALNAHTCVISARSNDSTP